MFLSRSQQITDPWAGSQVQQPGRDAIMLSCPDRQIPDHWICSDSAGGHCQDCGIPQVEQGGCKMCCGVRPSQIQLRVLGDFQAKSSSRTEVYWRTGPALHSQSSSLEPLMTSKANREIRQAPLLRNWNKLKVSSDNWSKAEINASFHRTVSILGRFETFQTEFKLFLNL